MPSTEPTRRRVLAAAGTAALSLFAGCSALSEVRNAGESSGAPTLGLQLSDYGSSLRDHHVVDFEATRVDWDDDAFRAARDGTDYETPYKPPFPYARPDDPAYVRRDGTYYHLDAVVTGERSVTHPVLRLYAVDDASDESLDPLSRADLPEIDQRAVHIAYMVARARGNEGGVPWEMVPRGGYVYHGAEARERSRLLSESEASHVRYRDAVYRIEVSNETFYEPSYRPVAEPVAETPAGMETILRSRLLDARVDPATLSEAERRVVREARGDGYDETHPFSDAYASLLKALGERAYLDGDVENDGGDSDRIRMGLLGYGERYYRYVLELSGDEN